MRTLSIVGARPQFIKLAPVSRAMKDLGETAIDDIIIHTGQHYDPEMSKIFFEELQIPEPRTDLAVGSGSHGVQTARMLELIEAEFIRHEPDMVVVYGDTNSTIAGAIAAAKLNVPIAHIEAGLRSFDRSMPEEVNRIVADHVSDILFAPTMTAVKNLENENLGDRTYLVGDVMLDAVLFNEQIAESRPVIDGCADLVAGDYAVATLHRASNTDSEKLAGLLQGLNRVASEYCAVLFPAHPRTMAKIRSEYPDWKPNERLRLMGPIGYLDMIRLLGKARLVMTDSGGLQKEAFFLGTPCITLRDETEWPETIDAGANCIAGTCEDTIAAAAKRWLDRDSNRIELREQAKRLFGGGEASANIVNRICGFGIR
jgi:UDP-GlcNAc3NAcA epimerase